jgi:peptidoglycan-associated lipoprotein
LNAKNTSLNIDIKEGLIVENIYYDFGKWSIRSIAAVQLDKIVAIIKSNPNLIIELSSHTDSRASDLSNMVLSEKRAREAVAYIVSKGADPARISGKGYGETRLINKCSNEVKCSEEEHQQNRRTEIKISRQAPK